MDSAALAAYEIIALVVIGAILFLALGGYAVFQAGYSKAWREADQMAQEIQPLIPSLELQTTEPQTNPLEWEHLSAVEQEQTL